MHALVIIGRHAAGKRRGGVVVINALIAKMLCIIYVPETDTILVLVQKDKILHWSYVKMWSAAALRATSYDIITILLSPHSGAPIERAANADFLDEIVDPQPRSA